MTEYLKKRFSVKTGERSPADCAHGWLDPKLRCVLCGEQFFDSTETQELGLLRGLRGSGEARFRIVRRLT